ncbi:MAG TPA: alpha-glucuronidase family glycosyl hydrolase, partial [Acidobacteriaceae bacterium]|nr:alpha-glucuronidase family glycosyl hydrolase [Acidobacteriaceae bacterium]
MFARAALSHFQKKALSMLLLLGAGIFPSSATAEDGSAAWLRYAPPTQSDLYASLSDRIAVAGDTTTDIAAAKELQTGLSSMLKRPVSLISGSYSSAGGLILLEAEDERQRLNMDELRPAGTDGTALRPEEYIIRTFPEGTRTSMVIRGGSSAGVLYGVFHVLELIASQRPLPAVDRQSPSAPIRWTDEWDNLNGTIERGFAGLSIFFDNGHVRADLTRAGQYARLLASVGINGCNINNVNADLDLLTTDHLREFARIADAFRPWGVKLALSVDLTSPQTVGNLPTFDPKDPTVIAWWDKKVDEIYTLIPDFGGFTVKADSEGRKGPSQYGRSPADAANVLARALAPHHGVVLYRGFVYNNHL